MTNTPIILLWTSLITIMMTLWTKSNMMLIIISYPLLPASNMNMQSSFMLDWMTLSFASTVILISSMVMLFSTSYIPQQEYNQFSKITMIFIMSMIILIMSDNIIFIILGWDGLGLSSFILVMYYQNHNSSASSLITLMSNRMGDISLLMAMALLSSTNNWSPLLNKNFNTTTMILIIMAAMTKSAQFPFSAWLPAAMAAPTPISALVHSSTLVTAGTYILIRTMNNNHPTSMTILLMVSTFTAISASLSANWEQDMKKMIALSTLSQIAFMMFTISMNMTTIAFFHLLTHAFFKSTMFLCAGFIIHNSSYQDHRMMSFSLTKTPIMLSSLGITTLALMGTPFLAGFYSKDTIMENMMNSSTNKMMISMMIMSIGLTTCYSIRMTTVTLSMQMKTKTDLTMDSNNNMETSILILTPLSILLGTWLSWQITPSFTTFLPLQMKMLSTTMIILGLITGMTLTFQTKNFFKMMPIMSSMWFMNPLSSYPSMLMMKKMLINQMLDNTWNEMMPPQKTFNTLKMLSTKIPSTKTLSLFLFILMPLLLTQL